MKPIFLHYNNSPKIYYKKLILFDYYYSLGDPPALSEELDYYKYSSDHLNIRFCNRLFCIRCLKTLKNMSKYEDIVKHKCDFCRRECECTSCLTGN